MEQMDRIIRVVTRRGKQVEIVHYIGSYVSKPIVYKLPSYSKAKAFEKLVSVVEGEHPVTIPREWREYLMEEVRDELPPVPKTP